MAEHLSKEQIAFYCERSISPAELIAVDDHLASCERCRHEVATLYGLNTALTAKAETDDPHLSYEQMEAYIDGNMPDAGSKAILLHTRSCSMCAQELRDLEDFREELDDAPASERTEKASWQTQLASWLTVPRLAVPLAATIIILVFLFWHKRIDSDSHQTYSAAITQNTPHPAVTSSPANEIAALLPEEQQALQAAMSQQKLLFPTSLKDLGGGNEKLMSGIAEDTKKFEVSGPAGEVTDETRPVFRWKPLKGAASYTVTVFDTNLNPVESSPALPGRQWKSTRALDRGRIYAWQVSATLSDGSTLISPQPPSPEARFQVLSQTKADEFDHYRQLHPESHLALGILYAEAGMLDAAKDEFGTIPSHDPDFKTAQKFLASIEQIRHPAAR